MSQSIPILTLTVTAASALTAARFVGPDGNPAPAGGNALGVARSDAAAGEQVGVDVLGTAVVESAGALAAGSAVEVSADGRAAALNTGVAVGRLAPGESATAAGEMVEILLLPN